MSRPALTAEIPALALRRAEAAAACGVSVETFDAQIRPFVPVRRLGSVSVYPVLGLVEFLNRATSVIDDLSKSRRAS